MWPGCCAGSACCPNCKPGANPGPTQAESSLAVPESTPTQADGKLLMTRIYHTIEIHRPIEAVYQFVTTPGHWPGWHPSSLGVSGAVDHSLTVGERCTEAFHVAGKRGEVIWTVTARDAPRRWTIEGVVVGPSANGGRINYTLTPTGGGTLFEREFVYPTPGLLFTLFDRLSYRRRVSVESAEALRRLKACLEHGR
jgi:uncharacterized protein YndB with AHSA1/START domain